MILVLADHDLGVLDPLSLEAVTAARAIDDDVEVLLVGRPGPAAASSCIEHGARLVHVAIGEALNDYTPAASARAASDLVAERSPAAVVATATARGNEVLAHLGAMLDEPFAAECVELAVTPGAHRVVRNRWGGSLHETAVIEAPVLLASIAARAVRATPVATPTGEVREFEPGLRPEDLVVRVVDRVGEATGGVGLADAKVVVAGGRGVGEHGFGPLEELAALLGGAVGCSRVVTSAGWRPHREQVGQTGTKVAPDLYLALGISGATQHLAGCRSSKTIIAINTDKEAPIMGFAHYAIVGDVQTVLPELVAAVRAATSR